MESPETRLLNLIKNKPKRKKRPGGDGYPGRKSFLAGITAFFSRGSRIVTPAFLKTVNRLLLLVFLGLSGYLIYSFVYPREDKPDFFISEMSVRTMPAETGPAKDIKSEFPEFSAYLKEIRSKDLFKSPPVKAQTKVAAADMDVARKFSLVGIIAGAKPQAVIEDKETQKTYYVYPGQSFSGVTVEEVGAGKVVLSYKGKQIELVL